MKKCRVWLDDKNLLDAHIDEKALTQRVLIPGTAWWDDADEERREDIMRYILYDEWYVTADGAELLASAIKDPRRFFTEEFAPAVEIDGVPYYLPFVYFYDLHLSNKWGWAMYKEETVSYTTLPFELEGKWGYIDVITGEIVIQPTWDYVERFGSYSDTVVGQKSESVGGKPCDIRCIIGEEKPMRRRLRARLTNTESGEIREWIVKRNEADTWWCGEVCTVKYGEIDLSGNIVTPLEDDLAERRNTIGIYEYEFSAIIHKNGKFLIRRYDDKILWEIETIEPNVEEEIKTEFDTGLDDDNRTHWIFTQWNENR
jgi:hypothetical protein